MACGQQIEPASAPDTGFEAVVDRHQSMVYSLALHFLHDHALAEDVAQEVFLQLHRQWAERAPEHLLNWLRRVTLHRSIDAARHRKRQPQVTLAQIPEPSGIFADRDPMLEDTLRRLLGTLAETPRAVMILRYQEDLDPTEIASILEIPLATVKSHLQRSLALLRTKMSARYGERQTS